MIKMNVLILESDPDEALRMRDLVARLGHGARPAGSGCEARLLLREQVFDLVFWDLEIDGDLGLPFIREYRRINGCCLLVAFTRENSREKEAAARAEGALRFLHKPAQEGDIRQVLAFAVRRTGGAGPPGIPGTSS